MKKCAIILLIALLLAACTPAGGGGEQPRGTLRWSLEGISDLTALDPARSVDYQSNIVVGLVFGGLVRLDEQLQVQPDGAVDWEVSRDGTVYTFRLRDNLAFGDGTPVTAEDFVFSLTRAIAPGTGTTFAAEFFKHIVGATALARGESTALAGVRAVDDRRLEITLDSPQAYFLSQLTYSPGFAVPRSLVESGADWEAKAFGSGPFRVREWRRGAQIALEANPHYWQGSPGIAGIDLFFIPDAGAAVDRYQAGELDLVGSLQSSLPVARLGEWRGKPDLRSAAAPVVRYIGFNNARPPFNNAAVRQAFALAVDKNSLAEQVLAGSVVPASRILPAGFPAADLPLDPLSFDPVGARSALGLTGFVSGGDLPPVTFTFADEGDNRAIADALRSDWADTLGVDVRLEPLPLDQFIDRLDATVADPAGGMDFYLSIWGADYPDPQNFLSLQLRTGSPFNNGHWSNPEFDTLTSEADRLSGPDQVGRRMQLYNQAERIAVREVGWLPLFHPEVNVLVRPTLSGLFFTPQGYIAPDWSEVRIAAR